MATPPIPPETGSIVLVGFMGTGKTTIGRRLAHHTRLPFADTDDLVVDRAGITIPEIFRMHGEPAFRSLESEVLASLDPATPRVLSTGGGIILDPSNRDRLRALGFVVWLSTSQEEILRRVSRHSHRPLVQGPDPTTTIARLLAERAPLYEAAADWTLDTTGRPIPETVRRILDRLGEAAGPSAP